MKQHNTPARVRTRTLIPTTRLDSAIAYQFRLRLADGTKGPRMHVPEGMTERQARADVAGQQVSEVADGMLMHGKEAGLRLRAAKKLERVQGELANDWFRRDSAKECGAAYRRISASVWGKWIAPHLEEIAIADLTRDKLEDIRDALDRAVDEKRVRHTANIWERRHHRPTRQGRVELRRRGRGRAVSSPPQSTVDQRLDQRTTGIQRFQELRSSVCGAACERSR